MKVSQNQNKSTSAVSFAEQQAKYASLEQLQSAGHPSGLQAPQPSPTLHMRASNASGALHAANDKLQRVRSYLFGEGAPSTGNAEGPLPPLNVLLEDIVGQCEALHEQIDSILSRMG